MLTWLPEQLRFLDDWRLVIYALILIVMMLVRPEGLLGKRRRGTHEISNVSLSFGGLRELSRFKVFARSRRVGGGSSAPTARAKTTAFNVVTWRLCAG